MLGAPPAYASFTTSAFSKTMLCFRSFCGAALFEGAIEILRLLLFQGTWKCSSSVLDPLYAVGPGPFVALPQVRAPQLSQDTHQIGHEKEAYVEGLLLLEQSVQGLGRNLFICRDVPIFPRHAVARREQSLELALRENGLMAGLLHAVTHSR